MAGTIPLSMTQQFDAYGKPLAGGQLYIIQAGTVSTPQDAFQDTGLTIKQPYPMTLDAAGRVPQFFVADGTVKIRLQDKNGVVQLSADSVLVIGPTAGTSSGVTVDPRALVQTGNLIFRYGVGAFDGYVRLNGLAIGDATSAGGERSNADTQALFLQLYAADTALVLRDNAQAIVARTTAANDYANHRNLALPDFRGYAVSALDDMGNTPAGRLTASYFGASGTLLGAAGGAESRLLTPAQCALVQHQHNVYIYDPGHDHALLNTGAGGIYSNSGNNAGTPLFNNVGDVSRRTNSVGTGIILGSSYGANNSLTAAAGGGNASASHAAIGPRKLVTFYMKL